VGLVGASDCAARRGGWGRTAEAQPTIVIGHPRQAAPSKHRRAIGARLGAICRSHSCKHPGPKFRQIDPSHPVALRERVEKREVRGEQERNGNADHRSPRALSEHGYKCNDGYARTSSPLFFGLEGRPCIARGEPRFAAEPRECGRPHVGGRVQDNDSHRRAPSPQQPGAGVAAAQWSVRSVAASERGDPGQALGLGRRFLRDPYSRGCVQARSARLDWPRAMHGRPLRGLQSATVRAHKSHELKTTHFAGVQRVAIIVPHATSTPSHNGDPFIQGPLNARPSATPAETSAG
jgi:hypothetical protein